MPVPDEAGRRGDGDADDQDEHDDESTLARLLTDAMIVEMTATGGLIIVGISLRLLDLKDVRLASFLPALAIAPLIVALLAVFG